jgi:hypothetical protein
MLVASLSGPALMRLFVWLYPHDGQDGLTALMGAIVLGFSGAIGSFALVYQLLLRSAARKNLHAGTK